MSRMGDYVIGEEEAGKIDPVEELYPQEPNTGIEIDDSVPIPTHLLERSNLNSRFGHLPFDSLEVGSSFPMRELSEKEFTALRARVSRANTKIDGQFALHTESREDGVINARVFRIE